MSAIRDSGSIVLVARHYPPLISGGTRRAALLAKGLRRRGWRVSVASPIASADEPHWIESPHLAAARGEAALTRRSSRGRRALNHVRNAVRRIAYWPDGDMRWALSTAHRINAAIRAGDPPDWIITSSPPESTHLAGGLIKARTGIRWLAELRDSWIDEPLREELQRSPARRFLERRLARTLLSRADHIVAVSEAIANEVGRFGASRPITVIGHFAEYSDATRNLDGGRPHLVHTGQFSLSHPQRTLLPVLDAFQRVLRTQPTATLHLVGRLTSAEAELASQHAASPRVRLYGALPYDEARSFQRAADALILYQPDTAALPGKISEYLLCSAPIVTVGAGRWLDRMHDVPHWPLDQLDSALAAVPRKPVDVYAKALDRYEAILAAPDISQRAI